ncbi:hypothetical protein FHS21_005381 [Phyllobacterium trifolii]|uniref:Uncharacterized protein n=1 Tax=Phyllobacterium trifolii TaxID=300193 RepID=A0A839UGM9_9HYPH|nr:hypothetical protein [Phyllobacterium trifolii]
MQCKWGLLTKQSEYLPHWRLAKFRQGLNPPLAVEVKFAKTLRSFELARFVSMHS